MRNCLMDLIMDLVTLIPAWFGYWIFPNYPYIAIAAWILTIQIILISERIRSRRGDY